MKILITGATSMIGAALAEKLIAQGHQIVAVTRRQTEKLCRLTASGRVEVVVCEMKEYGTITEKVQGEIDIAVLLAWGGTRGEARNHAEIQRNNLEWNVAILPQLLQLGCRKVVTAGSQAEYGNWTLDRKIRENDPECPNTRYGIEKLNFYYTCCRFAEQNGLEVMEPRFFSLYGPEDDPGTLIISILKKMLDNRPCQLTECIQRWDYLYIDDAINGLAALITGRHAAGVYNFGSGESFALKHYIEEMYRLTGSHSRLDYGAVPYPATGMVNVNPDVSKLMAIGWRPTVTFERGIEAVIRRLREQTRP